MRRPLAIAMLLASAAATACGAGVDGPPHIEEDRTACALCGMLVSERAYAAAYRTRALKGRATDAGRATGDRVFDDIGCLLKAARAEKDLAAVEFWFHDARTREWIDGERALIVAAPSFRTPMAGGMLAYGGPDAAREAAQREGGRVIGTIDDLLKEGGR